MNRPAKLRSPRRRCCFWLLLLLLLRAAGQGAGDAPRPAITDPEKVFALPAAEKNRPQPLHIEGRIDYFDPRFRMVWIERRNVATYLLLAADPPTLHIGDYVDIEGEFTPNQGLSAADVKVRVITPDLPVTPLDTRGRINDLAAFHGRIVTVEGYVDRQQLDDPEHVRLVVIVENRPVICWFRPDDPAHVPEWSGRFVRVTGLYSRRFDPTQTASTIEIWGANQAALEVTGAIKDSALFERSRSRINQLWRARAGTEVMVRGTLVSQRAGRSMIVRDDTGQVEVRSIQLQRLPVGAEVEVAGRVALYSGQWVIDEALYRPFEAGPHAPNPSDATLRTVAQVRALTASEAAQGQPVTLRGVVIWALPDRDFLFLQDYTGSVRVRFDPAKTGEIRYDKFIEVKGVTRAEPFCPAVELASFTDLGSLSHPSARPITLDEALTGKEQGQWVELRGFLKGVAARDDWRWLEVTTPAGAFRAQLQSTAGFIANPGSLVTVRGVCENSADAAGRVAGIMLRVPFLTDITVEEDAPADFYDLPRRAIRDLGQLSADGGLRRVRIAGGVLDAEPDGSIYVQEGDAAVLVLGAGKPALAPGDQLEAVGVLGREGFRTVLREAVWRKAGAAPVPAPLELDDPAQPPVGDDGRLVRVRGTLIGALVRPEHTRLTLQKGDTTFEAFIPRGAGDGSRVYAVGSGLELTGVCRLHFDDSRRLLGAEIRLRGPADVVVFRAPQFWTLRRALVVVALLGGATVLGLAWIAALRRQVRRQTGQIRAQLQRQAALEAEVQRAARLESLGLLAGGIAHDFNNALTGIMGYTSIAMLEPAAMAAAGDCLKEIDRGARRARELTQQLLTFAKGGDPVRGPVALATLVQECADAALPRSRVRYDCIAPAGLWNVHADRTQIAQVLAHLLQNAVQAMPRGGDLRIELANEQLAPAARAGLAGGPYVRLDVTDTGEGISAENLPRIFEPYFTTRQAGGMGLATVYSIVKKHEGAIEVRSTVGQGSTFSVWLPAAPASAPAAALPGDPARPGPGPGRVLLMDDEETIRALAGRVLQQLGLEVTAVADGTAAVAEFDRAAAAGRPYGLVILDLTIPGGMGGKETIEQLRRRDSDFQAIVSSGYSSDPVMANHQEFGFQAVVPKPYNVTQLMETVERLLHGTAPTRPRS
ncbi:MAG TPA: ATP-binding protein [Lacunisphaera sp.]|nr:ATP-binding protein [Lacunisphaera sp.]